jgi:hypothetical protein
LLEFVVRGRCTSSLEIKSECSIVGNVLCGITSSVFRIRSLVRQIFVMGLSSDKS